jgi:hypothetical protein
MVSCEFFTMPPYLAFMFYFVLGKISLFYQGKVRFFFFFFSPNKMRKNLSYIVGFLSLWIRIEKIMGEHVKMLSQT